MNSQRSTSYCSSNKVGEEEVTIEYERTFLQWLFNKPATIQHFVGRSTVWYHKGSGERAGTVKEFEIVNIVEKIRQDRIYGTTS